MFCNETESLEVFEQLQKFSFFQVQMTKHLFNSLYF